MQVGFPRDSATKRHQIQAPTIFLYSRKCVTPPRFGIFPVRCDAHPARKTPRPRLAHTRRDRDRVVSGGKRAGDPETDIDEPAVGVDPVAKRGAEDVRIEVPGPAAENTATAIAASPSRAVGRRSAIAVVVTILRPIVVARLRCACIGRTPQRPRSWM